jgi:uracil permease
MVNGINLSNRSKYTFRSKEVQMIYNIKDKLPFKEWILFSTQLMLSVVVATILIANICGTSVPAALVGAGISTIAYLLVTGFSSPMFISSSGAFVAPVMTALATAGYAGAAFGGLVSCIIYCVFGYIFTKVPVESIYKVFPKALIGAVTCVIGINLMPFCLTYVQINGATNMWGMAIAMITMLAIAIISHYAKGISKILPFLLGTLIGYAVAIIITITGLYPIVDFSVFNNLTWFHVPDFGFTYWGDIDVISMFSIAIIYAAYTVSALMECLSDHAALGGIIGTDLYKTPGLSRIFLGTGIANLLNGCIGGLGSCSYGEGVATVGFSKVASTRVTLGAALMLVLLGFFAPVQAFISSIPSCVFCGSALILYGYIACSGIKMLQQVDLNIQKNLVITSAVLSLGISGLVFGSSTISFSATALSLIVGVILNFILKEA